MKKNTPLVSLIVTTKNEERNMETILSSLKNQTYRNIEIIVVDNHSTDQTQEISRQYTDRVFNKGPERSTQRNFAVEQAKGKYILILDADMKLEPEVVEECMQLAQKGHDAVIIPEESYGTSFWAQCKWVEKRCYQGDDTMEAARFFKRDLYLKLGGFDANLISGEDWDLMERARQTGARVGRVKALIHHNEWHLSLKDTLKKKYYYGQKISSYRKKSKTGFQKHARFFRPAFFRNWKFLAKNPVYTFGMFFMKGIEFGVAGFGLVVSKVKLSKR